MSHTLTYSFLAGALLLYLYACKILIDDARQGYTVTMGGEMYFSQIWTIAAIFTAVGLVRLFAISAWFAIPGLVLLYLVSIPVCRLLKLLFLGLDLGKENAEDNNQPKDQYGRRKLP